MIGVMCGDFVGSRFERSGFKSTEFDLIHPDCRITDDTILSTAVMEVFVNFENPTQENFRESFLKWGLKYYEGGRGFSKRFIAWLDSGGSHPYYADTNGSAMRVASCSWIGKSIKDVERLAILTALPTHNHPYGIVGAVATAIATRMALEGWEDIYIKDHIKRLYNYDLDISTEEIRPNYSFKMKAKNSVPQALRCALESETWEKAVRLAVSLGGDSDTQAAIAGGFMEAKLWNQGKFIDKFKNPMFSTVDGHVLNIIPVEIKNVLENFYEIIKKREYRKSDLSTLTVMNNIN